MLFRYSSQKKPEIQATISELDGSRIENTDGSNQIVALKGFCAKQDNPEKLRKMKI